MSTRYDHIFAADADEAVALAVEAAEHDTGKTGWLLDAIREER